MSNKGRNIPVTPHLAKLLAGEFGHTKLEIIEWHTKLSARFAVPSLSELGINELPAAICGTELQSIFAELSEQTGIVAPPDCTCPQLRDEMDSLGVDGCRLSKDRLVEAIRENVRKITWENGAARDMVLESIPTLFDEAVRRAEAKAHAKPATRQRSRRTRKASVSCCGGKKKAKAGIEWAYGVTTVPSRRDDLLPKTLASLAAAGFNAPRLFVDGTDSDAEYRAFGLPITAHYPKLGHIGNWWLALAELYARSQSADLFAIFQDDFVACRNIRRYLELVPYPANGYWNLCTFPENERFPSRETTGWFESHQKAKGAVALVFNNAMAARLLEHRTMFGEATSSRRVWRSIDGRVLKSMSGGELREYVHNPSLVRHIGDRSSIGNDRHPNSRTFRGEDFDALSLLNATEAAADHRIPS